MSADVALSRLLRHPSADDILLLLLLTRRCGGGLGLPCSAFSFLPGRHSWIGDYDRMRDCAWRRATARFLFTEDAIVAGYQNSEQTEI